MSKLESLTQRIMDDAKAKADSIMAEADRKSKSLLNTKIKEAQDKSEKLLEKAHSEAAMAKDRVVSSAELKVRDEKLSAKQEILDTVFGMAKNKLEKLDDTKYGELLGKTLGNITIKRKGTLVVPPSRKSIAEKVSGALAVTTDENMLQGFMIKDEDIVYNYTFESLVDEAREQLEGDIALELFKELE